MKIYLFRHAQKAMDFSGDPDLTPEGHAQASKLLDKVLKSELSIPTELWVSPKKRTMSTFRPLAQHFSLELKAQEGLLEQQREENISQFRARIQRLLDAAVQAGPQAVIYLCTHYDWVVEAMSVIPTEDTGDHSHWSPCQYVALEVQDDGMYKITDSKKVQL